MYSNRKQVLILIYTHCVFQYWIYHTQSVYTINKLKLNLKSVLSTYIQDKCGNWKYKREIKVIEYKLKIDQNEVC